MAERGFMALSLMIDDKHCDGLLAAIRRFIERRRELL